jgi:plastocyanin
MTHARLALFLCAAASALACKNAEPPTAPAPALPAPAQAGTPGKTGTAKISGRVLFKGPPAEGRDAVKPFPECGERQPIPAVLLGDGGALANAFVWVREGLPPGDYPVPAEKVVLDQRHCDYQPRVFGIRAGQTLLIQNSDDLLHNVNARGQGAGLSRGPNSFNVAMPIKGLNVERRFSEQQVAVPIVCDVHPWMRAFAGVVSHPFFAVTGKDGAFTLQGLPAGKYVVEAWHERLGKAAVEVTVAEGASATAEIELKP